MSPATFHFSPPLELLSGRKTLLHHPDLRASLRFAASYSFSLLFQSQLSLSLSLSLLGVISELRLTTYGIRT